MTSRERVKAAVAWEGPDRVPIRYFSMPGPMYEHGEKLFDLWERYPHDYGPPVRVTPVPRPDPADFRSDGSYRSVQKDDWGITWEYLHFGIMGHPLIRPLDDLANLKDYKPPEAPKPEGPAFEAHRANVAKHKERYYCLAGAGGIFERLIGLRRFEDVLMDIADDTPEINAIADMVAGVMMAAVRYHLAAGVDCIAFGDDFGTEKALIIGLDTWRRFFAPRYEALMAPIREAGVDIEFHSCGAVGPLVDDLAALGVRILWPQLTAVDNDSLAAKLRRHKMTLLAHPDRRRLMQQGTPEEVKAAIARIRSVFGSADGGLIFYGEPDLKFPFENIQAMSEAFYGV